MYVWNMMYLDVAISVCINCVVLIFFNICAHVCVVTIITKGRIIIINLYYEENKRNKQKCMVGLRTKNEWGGDVSWSIILCWNIFVLDCDNNLY